MSEYYLDPKASAAYDSESYLMQDDIPFYVDLAREAQAASQEVLEIACGTGRVTLPIAQAGVRITGLDNSEPMLAIARPKAAGLGNVTWVQADMRDFQLVGRFGLIIVPYRSFLVLHSSEDQKACLRRIQEHLLPGGRLALNFFNPDPVMIGEWQSILAGSLQRLGHGEDPDTGHRLEHWQSNTYDLAAQELLHTRVTDELDEDGRVIERRYKDLRLRFIYRFEMEHPLALCGFEVEALFGWFDKRPFENGSPELVWLARRA